MQYHDIGSLHHLHEDIFAQLSDIMVNTRISVSENNVLSVIVTNNALDKAVGGLYISKEGDFEFTVVVHPDARNEGIATELVKRSIVLFHFKKQDIGHLPFLVKVRSPAMRELLFRNGFSTKDCMSDGGWLMQFNSSAPEDKLSFLMRDKTFERIMTSSSASVVLCKSINSGALINACNHVMLDKPRCPLLLNEITQLSATFANVQDSFAILLAHCNMYRKKKAMLIPNLSGELKTEINKLSNKNLSIMVDMIKQANDDKTLPVEYIFGDGENVGCIENSVAMLQAGLFMLAERGVFLSRHVDDIKFIYKALDGLDIPIKIKKALSLNKHVSLSSDGV